jgi:lipopolysaccharide transport system ATP-binding protein
MNEVAIRIENLSKCYQIYEKPVDRLKQFVMPRIHSVFGNEQRQYFKEFWALRDVSFEVKKGETVGIIGRNGSGKSTLLQMIAGTLFQTEGNVEVNGRVAALLELGAGFNPEFTGRENIFLHASILGVEQEVMNERVNDVIEFSGLKDHIDQPMKTYSSGMYARLAFASAIHVDPAILIVDEALAVGDAGFQLKCMLKMREIQDRGVTILFVSHDTGSVVRLCDRAIVLDQGKMLPGDQNPLNSVKLYEEITRSISQKSISTIPNNIEMISDDYSEELLGIDENRFGSREAEYLNIRFFGDDNIERKVFKSGDEIEIVAIIKSQVDIERVVSGFTLKNKAGVDVWGDNSLYSNTNISLKKGLSQIRYRFKLWIPEGEYFLYVGLADISRERKELDQRWPVRKLTVLSSRQVIGFTYSPASIVHEDINE